MSEIPESEAQTSFNNQPDLSDEGYSSRQVDKIKDRDINEVVEAMRQTSCDLLNVDETVFKAAGQFSLGDEFRVLLTFTPNIPSPSASLAIEFISTSKDKVNEDDTLYRIVKRGDGDYVMYKGLPLGERAETEDHRVYRPEAEMVAKMMKELEPLSKAPGR